MRDALCDVTTALPDGATSVTTDSIDLMNSEHGHFDVAELVIVAPALAVGELADNETMTYAVIESVNADLSSPTTLDSDAIVQTGAEGDGAAGQTVTFEIPSNVKRYIGVTVTNSDSGDASGKSVNAYLRFV